MPYPPDPGGNFASDAHRRVLMAVPTEADHVDEQRNVPHTLDDIFDRIFRDEQFNPAPEEITEILSDLEADGDVTQVEGGWLLTQQGADVGAGNNAWNGGRVYGETA